jgi:hypothetical protein
VPPGGQRRNARRRLIGDQLAPLVGERCPRVEHRDRGGSAEPGLQLLGDAIADLGVPGDPDDALVERQSGRQIGLRAVRYGDDTGMPADPSEIGRRPDPFADRAE